MKIERERVVAEALALLQEVGLDGLTTRRLAERLGVKQPALYWHFANKRALLDAMNAAMLAGSQRLPQPGEGWRAYLATHAAAFRRALLAHRDGARVHAGAHGGRLDAEVAEAQLRCLVEAGFAEREALLHLVALGRYVVGAVLEQQAEEAHPIPADPFPALPHLARAFQAYARLTPDEAFEHGLQTLLAGMAG